MYPNDQLQRYNCIHVFWWKFDCIALQRSKPHMGKRISGVAMNDVPGDRRAGGRPSVASAVAGALITGRTLGLTSAQKSERNNTWLIVIRWLNQDRRLGGLSVRRYQILTNTKWRHIDHECTLRLALWLCVVVRDCSHKSSHGTKAHNWRIGYQLSIIQ